LWAFAENTPAKAFFFTEEDIRANPREGYMQILQINIENPQKRFITKAAEVLEAGGVILFPTDTVYAFSCDITGKKARLNGSTVSVGSNTPSL